MVPGLIASFTIFPASTLAYAWTLAYGTNLAGPLICSFFMGASICAVRGGRRRLGRGRLNRGGLSVEALAT
jgi:hypothetical protein